MKRKRTSAADPTPIRVVIVTLDNHLSGVMARAQTALRRQLRGLELCTHAASTWEADAGALLACLDDIAGGDIILVTMLFMENHINAVLPALTARRDDCDTMVCLTRK